MILLEFHSRVYSFLWWLTYSKLLGGGGLEHFLGKIIHC